MFLVVFCSLWFVAVCGGGGNDGGDGLRPKAPEPSPPRSRTAADNPPAHQQGGGDDGVSSTPGGDAANSNLPVAVSDNAPDSTCGSGTAPETAPVVSHVPQPPPAIGIDVELVRMLRERFMQYIATHGPFPTQAEFPTEPWTQGQHQQYLPGTPSASTLPGTSSTLTSGETASAVGIPLEASDSSSAPTENTARSHPYIVPVQQPNMAAISNPARPIGPARPFFASTGLVQPPPSYNPPFVQQGVPWVSTLLPPPLAVPPKAEPQPPDPLVHLAPKKKQEKPSTSQQSTPTTSTTTTTTTTTTTITPTTTMNAAKTLLNWIVRACLAAKTIEEWWVFTEILRNVLEVLAETVSAAWAVKAATGGAAGDAADNV